MCLFSVSNPSIKNSDKTKENTKDATVTTSRHVCVAHALITHIVPASRATGLKPSLTTITGRCVRTTTPRSEVTCHLWLKLYCCANSDCTIDTSSLVSFQCVHGRGNNKLRKAATSGFFCRGRDYSYCAVEWK